MTINISEGVLVSAIVAFLGVTGRAIWAVAAGMLASMKASDASREVMVKTQGEILAKFGLMADTAATKKAEETQKAVEALARTLARSHPSLLLCGVCGGWDGPAAMKPDGVKACNCSERPPGPKV